MPCGQGKGYAVARLFVISQALSNQMFHFLCESLPRLGYFADWLSHDATFAVHASCLNKPGYCTSLLEALGIPRHRVVGFPAHPHVFAHEVLIPPGGRRHWPMSNMWGIHAVRRRVLGEPLARQGCFAVDPARKARVLMLRRARTKLSPFSAHWYDAMRDTLHADPGVAADVQVDLFDDADAALMKDFSLQLAKIRAADVLLGAHGAGMSLLMFARPCTRLVSIRGRTNSDVYEQLAFGLGMGFHHVHFAYSFAQMYLEMRNEVRAAVDALRANTVRLVAAAAPVAAQEHVVIWESWKQAFGGVLVLQPSVQPEAERRVALCQALKQAMSQDRALTHGVMLHSSALVSRTFVRDYIGLVGNADLVEFRVRGAGGEWGARVYSRRALQGDCQLPEDAQVVRVLAGVDKGWSRREEDGRLLVEISPLEATLADPRLALEFDGQPWDIPPAAVRLGLLFGNASTPPWFYVQAQARRRRLPRNVFAREPPSASNGLELMQATGVYVPLVLVR